MNTALARHSTAWQDLKRASGTVLGVFLTWHRANAHFPAVVPGSLLRMEVKVASRPAGVSSSRRPLMSVRASSGVGVLSAMSEYASRKH